MVPNPFHAFILFFLIHVLAPYSIHAFHHNKCSRKQQAQFQFEDCYLPPLDTSLTLSQASFLMSHDSATGYVKRGSLSASGLTWRYSKNQVGSVYQQLDDGARALDLRPKLLSNGTVIFQHGDVNIPVWFETLVEDAVRWCEDNPDELVLLLPSNFAYQSTTSSYALDDDFYAQDDTPSIVAAMTSIYENFGVTYLHCTDVYEMNIYEIQQIAKLPKGGYLLALDGQDYYGSPCAKPNWSPSQLVACYSTYQNTTLSCARRNPEKMQALKFYMLASSNNQPSNDFDILGPPADTYTYPLNEIQALWQVTTASAVMGISHLSSILDDNQKSNLNQELMDMIYKGQFNSISVFAADNVALHGNALLSVLRTACGQSSEQGECGADLAKPRLNYFQISKLAYAAIVTLYIVVLLWISMTIFVAIRDRQNPHPRLLWTVFQRLSDNAHPSDPTSSNKKVLI